MSTKPIVLFMTSYVPRECGIATFTQDTIEAIEKKFSSNFELRVAALNEHPTVDRIYPKEVMFEVEKTKEAYLNLAQLVNENARIKMVVLEHEYGLFAGEFGEDLLSFINVLKKPYLAVLHTALPSPPDKMKSILSEIIKRSSTAITMTQYSKKVLVTEYGATEESIEVIPHGFHQDAPLSKKFLKTKHNCKGKIVYSTFGLLSSNKGLETAIEALGKVKETHTFVYYILGKTHPEVKKHSGEEYRDSLKQLVKKHGLEENVRFINRFLSKEELLEFLQLTNVYLFTSTDLNQAVSGTLSYALGAGCAVLTTPISHAHEILEAGAALSFGVKNSDELAQRISQLVQKPKQRKALSS